MQGVLKQVSANCWRGELGGYQIEVAKLQRLNAWIFTRGNDSTHYTRLELTGDSIENVASRAREWSEANPRGYVRPIDVELVPAIRN
jgi:hypothetical protein